MNIHRKGLDRFAVGWFTGLRRAGKWLGASGNRKGRPSVGRQPFLLNAELDILYRLKGSGFIQSLSDVQPDIRLTAAVAADGMTFRFALALEDVYATIKRGRSGQGSLPCSTPLQSRAGTAPGSPHFHRLPRRPGVGSSNRR